MQTTLINDQDCKVLLQKVGGFFMALLHPNPKMNWLSDIAKNDENGVTHEQLINKLNEVTIQKKKHVWLIWLYFRSFKIWKAQRHMYIFF